MKIEDIQEQFLAGFVKQASVYKISEEASLQTIKTLYVQLEKFAAEVDRLEKSGMPDIRQQLLEKFAEGVGAPAGQAGVSPAGQAAAPGWWDSILKALSPESQGSEGQAWNLGLGGAGIGAILGALLHSNNPLLGLLIGALGGGGLGAAYGRYGNAWFKPKVTVPAAGTPKDRAQTTANLQQGAVGDKTTSQLTQPVVPKEPGALDLDMAKWRAPVPAPQPEIKPIVGLTPSRVPGASGAGSYVPGKGMTVTIPAADRLMTEALKTVNSPT